MTDASLFKVEFSRRAAAEVRRARVWRLAHREKAPDPFDLEIRELVAQLEEAPQIHGAYARNMPGLRRAYLKRIRYYAYYRVVGANQRVQVLSLWHSSRSEEPNVDLDFDAR